MELSPSHPDRNEDVFEIADLVEKPSTDEAPSTLRNCGRYVFAPGFSELFARRSSTGTVSCS
jgi:UTP--glucose-1-phosphate uridylyltransferase